jgi:hypothetical protein
MVTIASIVRRQNIALILIGIAFSSLGYYLSLHSDFVETTHNMASRPDGFDCRLASHGEDHYLSPVQATELGILKYVFAVSFLAGVIFTMQVTQTVELLFTVFIFVTSGVARYRSEEFKRSSNRSAASAIGSAAFFFVAMISSFALFWFSTLHVASALVLRNVILRP